MRKASPTPCAGASLLVLAVAFIVSAVDPASAQEWVPYGEVAPSAHTVSPEVRSLPDAPGRVGTVVQVPLLHRPSFVPGGGAAAADPVAQAGSGSPLNAIVGAGFDGVSFNGYYPPDPNLSVSDTQIVQTTNVEWAVYDKSGLLLKGPVTLTSLFGGLGNLCSTVNGGDPIVLWDKIAHRWMISQLAYNSNFTNNFVCIAVSQTSDALGVYNLYSFNFSHLPDYPKFGVWSSSSVAGGSDYYMSANLFSTALYYGPVVCAFNGADLQNGAATPRFTCSQSGTSHFSLLPSDLDGSTPPATGEPNYVVELGTGISSTSGTTLNMFPFTATWTSAGGSLNSPSALTINVAAYSLACGGGGTCIPQPGTTTKLDSLGDRLMYRLAFRNFGTYESLVVNHAVDPGDGSVGIRWYQIQSAAGRTLASSRSVVQQGTFSPSGSYRWMGSISQDKVGNVGMGYSVSNATAVYPSIFSTGRAYDSSDPPGILGAESVLMTGSGAETGGSRWGDYSSLAVDPADDCTFWYTNEYFASGGSGISWKTRIAPFRFSTCGASLSSSSTALTSSLNPSNVGDSVTFTATVTPSAATGTVQFFDGSTSLGAVSLTSGQAALTTSGLAAGSHSITAVYGGDSTDSGSTSNVVAQTVNSTTAGSFGLGANPGSQTIAQGGSAVLSITVTPSGGFVGAVTLSVAGLPPQSTATFSVNPVPANSTASSLTIRTGRKTPKKSYTLTITGTSGSLTATTTAIVTVR